MPDTKQLDIVVKAFINYQRKYLGAYGTSGYDFWIQTKQRTYYYACHQDKSITDKNIIEINTCGFITNITIRIFNSIVNEFFKDDEPEVSMPYFHKKLNKETGKYDLYYKTIEDDSLWEINGQTPKWNELSRK